MQRRNFIKSSVFALSSTFCLECLNALGLDVSAPMPDVKRVLVMFKCHFDAGFIDTRAAVVRRYFSEYFPQAVTIAEQSRKSGKQRYVWTTGSWLLYEYLEQASPGDRRRTEEAIAQGDIAWHALPFTWQTEMLDASTISASVGISQSLDRRFGRTTTGAKMTDVPGHTRAIIPPLAGQGLSSWILASMTPALRPRCRRSFSGRIVAARR